MSLFAMYWQRTLKRPGAVLLWLALPFVFMSIYTMVFGNNASAPPKTTLAVVDEDSSFVSRLAKNALQQGPVADLINVVDASGMDAVDTMFRAESASAALVIPEGFGDQLLSGTGNQTLTLYTNPRHYIGPQIAEGVMRSLVVIGDGLLHQFNTPLRQIDTMDQKPAVDDIGNVAGLFYGAFLQSPNLSALQNVDVTIIEKEKEPAADFNLAAMFFPGLVMFGLLSVSLNLERRLLHDRVTHVTRRVVMAPVSPLSISFQQRLYTFSFVYVVGVLSAILGGIIWHIPPQGLVAANLIVIALALFVSGFNALLFSVSNSVRAVSALSSIIMVFLAILGGGFFPAELTPPGFQAVIKLIPTGMANLGLTHTLTGKPLGISLPALFAYCGAFFLVGTFVSQRRVSA